MTTKLEYGDIVKIVKPSDLGPVKPGSLDAAFEGRVGMVVGEENLNPKMYRVRFVPSVQVPGLDKPVSDDLWERQWLKKQRG